MSVERGLMSIGDLEHYAVSIFTLDFDVFYFFFFVEVVSTNK